ncbi:MAG: hypothetical protein CR217_09860 [Beijerinckiaceae bacterium]|nr:MAG: hypothetical protein CR217_09860 [Beijerinckiaceae bacterium]
MVFDACDRGQDAGGSLERMTREEPQAIAERLGTKVAAPVYKKAGLSSPGLPRDAAIREMEGRAALAAAGLGCGRRFSWARLSRRRQPAAAGLQAAPRRGRQVETCRDHHGGAQAVDHPQRRAAGHKPWRDVAKDQARAKP